MSSPRALFVVGITFSLIATARASVKEPDNETVPEILANGETTLPKYFMMAGEGIDAIADAHQQPATFLPLCEFTATYVLNESSNHYGLGWYNVIAGATTAPMLPADIHTIVPANTPIGQVITSANIKSDPAYLGGTIGFVLLGTELHYSESKWDTDCTSCAVPGPWVTALIYKSTKLANAYYVAFEDGPTSSSSWGNDGDFNDCVFLVSGLACQGGGVACMTGKDGVCAAGVTECDASGTLVCQQTITAGTESCNGLDDDCNGAIDDGALCSDGNICVRGQCLPPCGAQEFPCGGELVCDSANGTCVEPSCVGVACQGGQVCVGGTCQGGCVGVTCPVNQVCRIGRCVDPCVGVTCSGLNVCVNGVCVPSCTCVPCSSGLACAASGQCEDPGCVALDAACGAGTICETGGQCVDACQGVICPTGQVCNAGNCVDLPPLDMAMSATADLAMSAGDLAIGAADLGALGGSSPHGCQCRSDGSGAPDLASLLASLLVLAMLSRRTRRTS